MDFRDYKKAIKMFAPSEKLEKETLQKMNQRRRSGHVTRTLRYAAAICCMLVLLPVSVAAGETLFSSLKGDELGLSAVYEGNGLVSVCVDNRSDKDLEFQPDIKLMQWITGEEIERISDSVIFENRKVSAHSSSVLTIDLSEAYDMEALEVPLEQDWYYLVLTNNHFVFGQDWMCSVAFAEASAEDRNVTEDASVDMEADSDIMEKIAEELQFYFEESSLDVADRKQLDEEYEKVYNVQLSGFEGNIITSVSPILPGNRIFTEKPYLTVGQPDDDEISLLVGQNWTSRDARFKLLGTQGEYAISLSVALPLSRYDADALMPLFYIFTYEKAALAEQDNYAFIHGQLVSFEELEAYKVYEDEQYLCYEVSGLVYSDLKEYTESFVKWRGDIRYDEQVWEQVKKVYEYYKENLGELICYKEF